MGGYRFLDRVRVIEVAQLGPASLGGYLADMGAEVIKVEGRDGDPLRYSGSPAAGTPDGVSLLHLRWNRGKQSLGLDLGRPEGTELFRRLVAAADIVIEGMRGGYLDSLGLGYAALSALTPRLVYCSLSGLGRDGPYHTLGSHGPSFDAFGALSATNPYALSPEERRQTDWAPIGMHAMGLNAALGVLAALSRAQRTGQGALIEVTGAESAAHWLPEGVNSVLNQPLLHARPGFTNSRGKMARWPRLCRYGTADGRGLFFQALAPKFWERFCEAVGRPDLLQKYSGSGDTAQVDEEVHGLLRELFLTRSRVEWIELFLAHGVPGGPANDLQDLAQDPHFLARGNLYEMEHPGIGRLRLTGTPVKTPGQPFAPAPAPALGEHSVEILQRVLGLGAGDVEHLREAGAVLQRA